MNRICVFCGSGKGETRSSYAAAARQMGRTLARRGLTLVYGGGGIGLMRSVADAALEDGGVVIGVIPEALAAMEVAHGGISDLRIVSSMHERKAMMADLSDGFVALPGGFGTLEEYFEMLTWAQLGLHRKPCGLLNVEGFYNHLLNHFDHAMNEGFIPAGHRTLVMEETDPDRLLDRLLHYTPPPLHRWIERAET